MKKMMFALIILLLAVSGCSNAASTKEKASKKLQIVTTFYPMYYFTEKVAGDLADVELLIPNGVEPHDWEPSTKDMAKIQDADVFIYNSQYFETWTEKVLKSVKNDELKVVEASDGIELMDALETEEEDDHEHASSKDPHVWLSPVLAQQEVKTIAKALEQADPAHKEQYQQNADALNSQLVELDQLYKETIDQAKTKEFVTQHAAFGYLANQYGLTQIPIAGLSPDVEPTLRKLSELTEMTKEKNVKVIYFEEMTSAKVAKTLAKEIGAKTEVLNPLEGLTKEEQDQGLDYIGVMEKNLEALKLTIMN
ncbi:metal ABC transporter substrate-binding protein [Neobacillus muris]|uniref:metal ABC transporter substrate-binding protein n=1 Tax=Neobacillus muris TaxID=2941334 RepID=UPI0020413EA2|nr:metal ABC transporter substrate-binding protein [Neobacillus muris]